MSERFVSLDPWASRRPRRRDWLLLVSGCLALAAAVIHLILSADTNPAAAPVSLDAARMRQIEAQTRLLNEQVGRLEQPWSEWLRATLLDMPPGTGVLQLDIDAEQRRIKLVLDTVDFAAVEAAIARLQKQGLFTGMRASGHDRDSEGRLRAVLEGRLADGLRDAPVLESPKEAGR